MRNASASLAEGASPTATPRRSLRAASALGVLLAAGMAARAEAGDSDERILSLSPTATEILLALALGDRLVGVDDESRQLPGAAERPSVGPAAQPSLERVYALKPSRVVTTRGRVPPAVLEQLSRGGMVVEQLEPDEDLTTLVTRARSLGVIAGKGAEGAAIARQVERDLEHLGKLRERNPLPLVAVFLDVGPQGRLVVAGKGTRAHRMLELAGATNPAAAHSGMQALSDAAFTQLAPQAIVMSARALERAGGKATVLALPAVAETTAGRTATLVTVPDAALLGFGTGALAATTELFRALRR